MAPSHALILVTAQVSMGSTPRGGEGAPAFPWSLVVVALVVGGAIALAARAFRHRATPPPPRQRSHDGYPFRGPHDAHTTGGEW